MGDYIVIKSKLKEIVTDMNFSSDFIDELDKVTKELIQKAATRAKENQRKTIMPRDL